tara:strand:- start:4381 stop:5058 length:678 start_codon:yes stop_codon:yes gene_type:complete
VGVEILTEDTPIEDPPCAPGVDLTNLINQAPEVEEAEAVHSRPTRGTPDINLPTKADALQLKAGEWGDIITVYSKTNLNSKKVHGEVMVLQQEVDASDGEGCVKVEGDPPSTQHVTKVMAKLHFDDDDIQDKVVLWGEGAVFWTKYDGELAYIERSINSSPAAPRTSARSASSAALAAWSRWRRSRSTSSTRCASPASPHWRWCGAPPASKTSDWPRPSTTPACS